MPNPIDRNLRPGNPAEAPNGARRKCGAATRAGSGTAATAPATEGGSVTIREIWYKAGSAAAEEPLQLRPKPLAARCDALVRHMRAMRRRGHGAGHGVPASVARLDQPLFQPHHLCHHIRHRLAEQPVRGGGGIVPGLRPAQRIHHPHRLFGIEWRAAAP